MNKVLGAVLGLAAGYLVEKITEDAARKAGLNPRAVRVVGAVVGTLVS